MIIHPLPADVDRDLLRAFVDESLELLERAEPLVARADTPHGEPEALPILMRDLHTIKGTASFLALPHLVALAHELESVCGGLHDGRLPRSPQLALLVRKGFDLLSGLLGALAAALDRREPMVIPAGYRPLMEALLAPPSAAGRTAREGWGHAQLPTESFAELTLRIPTQRMDAMLGHIELLTRLHARLADARERREPLDPWCLNHIGVVLEEMRDMAQGMRMVPFHGTFRKLGRLARDTATYLAKAIEFHAEGGGVEVDRSIMEQIGDPLLHMVRNAIDHGIETAEERLRAGKPEAGTVWLSASLEGQLLTLVLRDDGRGLQCERLVAEGRRRGLLAADAAPSEAEAHALIFAPGFSTATHLTTLSGRGVGMDVVRERIETLGGRIAIHSVPGEGTTFTIQVPVFTRDGIGSGLQETAEFPAAFFPLAYAG